MRSTATSALLAVCGVVALAAGEEAAWRWAGHPAEVRALMKVMPAAALLAALLAGLLAARRLRASLAAAAALLVYAAGAWWLHPSRTLVEPPRPAAPGPPPPRDAAAPDIVLVVMDTTRRDRLSLYGHDRPTSPALDALARQAEVYDDAWSVAPWTPPSHASLLTGLLPAEHGVDGQDPAPFPAGRLTLTRVLRGAGYRTGGFVANPNLTAAGWDRDFDEYRSPRFRGRHSLLAWLDRWTFGPDHGDPWTSSGVTARTLALALAWWSAAPGRPRFLFVNLLDPHRPYLPPRAQRRRFLEGMDADEALAVDQDPDRYQLQPGLSERQARLLQALYDAEIASMDAALGRFLGVLRARGELDHTLLVVTSDHGERLGERGLVGHEAAGDRALDPTLLRVPLVIRYPARAAPRRVPDRMPLTRVAARILELAGIP
ncbi:MAG TPA: sulfatase, partial [Vicinamibacteria bacterium]